MWQISDSITISTNTHPTKNFLAVLAPILSLLIFNSLPPFYPNTWYQIHQFYDLLALEDHDYFTRRQKHLGAMDPSIKMLVNEM
jgi:hypothetical protein